MLSKMLVTQNDSLKERSKERLTGRVKWFNTKAGYGFITVNDGSYLTDIFVHHSSIDVKDQQYKYLIQGEYVEFSLVKTKSDKHEWQASNVCGISGGKLMCETRRELKQAHNEYKSVKLPLEKSIELPLEKSNLTARQKIPHKKNVKKLRDENSNDKEWTFAGASTKIMRQSSTNVPAH